MLFFINPVIATADALFSAFPTTDTTLSSSSLESDMPCHEEKNTDVREVNKEMQKEAHADMTEDCCADICLCDDSGCHGSSLVFQLRPQLIFNTDQDLQYNLPIYISLAYTPVSPPPNA
jgi:hypothetical protein